MKSYQAGQVVLLEFPFTDAVGAKRRPALVLLDTGDGDVVVARVTSQPSAVPYDVEIRDWQTAGLLLPSIARVHKVATIEKSLIERQLGTLTNHDWAKIKGTLNKLWRFT